MKIWNLTKGLIAPKGRIPHAILTKFTRFMRVIGLDNSAKLNCFSSINDNYKQFTSVGAFSAKLCFVYYYYYYYYPR